LKVLYGDMSWPEIKEAAEEGKVPLIPVGSTEQHGPHLPTKTDIFIAYELCKAAANRIPEEALVLPPVNYGYNEHHLDFPATINVNYETLIKFVIDVGRSLAHHGFRKIVIVNGHGSNDAPMEIAARRITLETPAVCASLTYLGIAPEVFNIIEGESAHGGDIETSIMLYLAPELVDMSKAVRDWSFPKSRFIKRGVTLGERSFAISGGAVKFMDWWSRISKTGILGDPTKASGEKGEKIFKIYVEHLVNFIREFKRMEVPPRKDHH